MANAIWIAANASLTSAASPDARLADPGGGIGRTRRRHKASAEAEFAGQALGPSPIAGHEHPPRVEGGSPYVSVVTDGFVYNGHQFKSLSEIARAITGVRWNGPKFFGLRAVVTT